MKNQHLTEVQHNELQKTLQKIEELFDVKLGICKTDPVEFEFNEGAKPICLRS